MDGCVLLSRIAAYLRDCRFSCSAGDDANSSDKSKSLLADIVKDDIEDESEVVQAVVDSTIETIDTVYTKLTENSVCGNVEGGTIEPDGMGE